MDGVWDITTPAAMIEARVGAAGAALRATLGDDIAGSSEVKEAATLARQAAKAAAALGSGRPLFAAPVVGMAGRAVACVVARPVVVARVSRRQPHRGNGVRGHNGCEALVTHAASAISPGATPDEPGVERRGMGCRGRVPSSPRPCQRRWILHGSRPCQPPVGRGPHRRTLGGGLRAAGRRRV